MSLSTIGTASRTLAEASLGMFAMTYEELSQNWASAPSSGLELFEMMKENIFDDEEKVIELEEEGYVEETSSKVLLVERPMKSSFMPTIKQLANGEYIKKGNVWYSQEKTPLEDAAKYSVPETKTIETQENTKQPAVSAVDEKTTKSEEEMPLFDVEMVKKALKSFVFEDENKKKHQLSLPYLPKSIDYSGGCACLSVNGGLYSPCMTRTKRMGVEASYCTSCSKGTPTKMDLYGTVTDRETNGTSPKSSISFGTYCAKRGVSREWVEEWVSKNLDGLIIPEKEWEVDEKKSKFARRRPSKASSTEGDATQKKRGRPAKTVQKEPITEEPVKETVAPAAAAAEAAPLKEEPVKETVAPAAAAEAKKMDAMAAEIYSLVTKIESGQGKSAAVKAMVSDAKTIGDLEEVMNMVKKEIEPVKETVAAAEESAQDEEEESLALVEEEQEEPVDVVIMRMKDELDFVPDNKEEYPQYLIGIFNKLRVIIATIPLLNKTKIGVRVKEFKAESYPEEVRKAAKSVLTKWKKDITA